MRIKFVTSPTVSIIIPCLNEEKNIQTLLDALIQQTYPLNQLEVIIADGNSTDQTRDIIADFQSTHKELKIKMIDNPIRRIPVGLNLAIKAAQGEIITRMDAHAIPANDYVEQSVNALKNGFGANVGGVIDIKPGAKGWIAESISVATAHPLGVGDAKYRWTKKAGEVDTVAFGTFFKSKAEEIGLFNEELIINEDYEFNTKIRATGGKIWVDPSIRAIYFSRATLKGLARQYFFYGFWKLKMLRKNPETIRWRQALPPLFVVGILMLLLLSAFLPLARATLAICMGFYLLILLTASTRVSFLKRNIKLVAGIPLAMMTMHLSWGCGFWWSLLNFGNKGK